MKALIATRFSDAKQIGGTSTATQLQVCDGYCKNNDFKVIAYHKVEAESAKSSNVARIAELLDFCRKHQGKANVLVVYKVDRFARDVGQHYYLKTELIKMGISLRSATEPIDDTPQGELMETILAGFAQFDNSVKRERVKLAMWARVTQGLWPWNPTIGYKPNKIAGVKLTPHIFDDICSEAIKEIFMRYSSGIVSLHELARDFGKRKIKNYKGRVIKFPKTSIQQILNNRYYIGLLTDKEGNTVKGLHLPLIDASLFQKCQEVQLKLSNHATRQRFYENPDFPLRRFVMCSGCGKPFTACWAKSGRYPYYYCINKGCPMFSKMIKKVDLENGFMDYLKKVKPTQEFVTRFESRFVKRYSEREQEIKGDYMRQTEEIVELQKQLEWVVTNGRKGILPENVVKEQVRELDGRITIAKMQLSETHSEELDITALLAYAETFIRTLEISWFDAPPATKLRLQRAIFPEGVVYQYPSFSNSKISPVFELINSLGSKCHTNVSLEGFEPSTSSLRGNCSTIELQAPKLHNQAGG
jgi:site-specific DNA recombinase